VFVFALIMLLTACDDNAPPTEVPASQVSPAIDCQHDSEFRSDGSGTPLGESGEVTKTWVVLNSGDCDWTTDYELVTVEKYKLSDGPESELRSRLNINVAQGDEKEIEVRFHAPVYDGLFTLEWQLQDPTGIPFGDILTLSVSKFAGFVCSTADCPAISPLIRTCPGGNCGAGGADAPALAICTEGDCGVPAMGVYACESGSLEIEGVSASYALDPTYGSPVICVYGVAPGETVVGTITDPSGNIFIYNGPALSLPEAVLPEEVVGDEGVDDEVIIESMIVPGRWDVKVAIDEQEVTLPSLEVVPELRRDQPRRVAP
jgi:hypothetical protein